MQKHIGKPRSSPTQFRLGLNSTSPMWSKGFRRTNGIQKTIISTNIHHGKKWQSEGKSKKKKYKVVRCKEHALEL